MSRREATARLIERIRAGEVLLSRAPRTWLELQQLTREYQLWSGENRDLLRVLFADESPGFEYSAFHGRAPSPEPSVVGRAAQLRSDIATKLSRLQTLARRTEVLRLAGPAVEPSPTAAAGSTPPARVLFAPGGDDEVGDAVTRLLEKLGVRVVSASSDRDRLIELVEAQAVTATRMHAIVLFTSRTRDRIPLDLGYVLGALGRSAVTVLREDGADVPSGLSGVFYIPLDAGGTWKLLLARDLKRAGFPIDTRSILSLL